MHRASALDELAACEERIEEKEKELEWYRLQMLMPFYRRRDESILKIPNFWKIVLSQHDDFANYVRASDFKYVDAIQLLIVKWQSVEEFDIIIGFQSVGQELRSQTITKHFFHDGDHLKSQPVEIKYNLPPRKKHNRFFDWFGWKGSDDKGEFPNGDGLAQLITDEIYPLCVKFYTEAQRDVADEDSSEESSEPELF